MNVLNIALIVIVIVALLIAVLALSSATHGAGVSTGGDADCDGAINSIDALLVQRRRGGRYTATFNPCRCERTERRSCDSERRGAAPLMRMIVP